VQLIIKVCGITRPADASMALAAGVDWLGLNFWPQSKRAVTEEQARAIISAAREAKPDATLVGVFVNQPADDVAAMTVKLGLDYVQLHGDEPPEACERFGDRSIKALALAGVADVRRMSMYPCPTFVVDTPTPGYGGSGETFDWSLARQAVDEGFRVLLAGGLRPENVGEAISFVAPFGVDVASGVESAPGIKDETLVREFVAAVKEQA
jgi:phosphoribosylanthranilate isomerase